MKFIVHTEKPILYDECGDFKYAKSPIIVSGQYAPEVIFIAIMPKLYFGMMQESDAPKITALKRAVYKRYVEMNCEHHQLYYFQGIEE